MTLFENMWCNFS